MNEQEPISPRRRLQVLLSIPDSERSDAEWDELNELEISLAPGNRLDGPDPNSNNSSRKPPAGRSRPPRQGGGAPQPKPAQTGGPNPAAPKKAFRRSPRRAPKGNAPKGDAPGGDAAPRNDAAPKSDTPKGEPSA
jgi:hypothetical protein